MSAEVLRAQAAFSVGVVVVRPGDLFAADDPVVKGREALFTPVGVRVRASVPGRVVEPAPFLNVEGGPVRPAGNASRDEWAGYVTGLGGDPGDLSRDALRDLATELGG